MAGKQRRQREQAGTRTDILAAALDLAREEGWSGVTMRKIAGRIDYTHAALYAYFVTKDELLLALFRDATDLLVAALTRAHGTTAEPGAALLAIARAYWAFAWDEPIRYQLLNGLGGLSLAVPGTVIEGQRVEAVVAAALDEWADLAANDTLGRSDRVTLLWAIIHGLASLGIAGRLSREHGARLVEQITRDLLGAWEIPPPRRDADTAAPPARAAP